MSVKSSHVDGSDHDRPSYQVLVMEGVATQLTVQTRM